MPARPVLAVAGLACETSTFTPSTTLAPAFHPRRGRDIIEHYRFLHADQPLGAQAEWKGCLIGHALPGGRVARAAFEALAGEMVARLQALVAAGPLHGLWLDLHGAMCVVGLDDAEAELLRRLRAVVGADVAVSASMDLHGNVSRALAHLCDLVTCYRSAPHEDVEATKARACRNLLRLVRDGPGRRPLKAWVPIPVLLPGEKTSTRMEPAQGIYAAVARAAAAEGVIDAAVWVGYAWADEPRSRAVAMVTGWDAEPVGRAAERLARLYWDARAAFVFAAPAGSLAACLDAAVGAPAEQRPFFISDSGDNPTAGGAGDVSWGLTQLLQRPEFRQPPPAGPVVIYASLPGPAAVATAVAAGVGAVVTVTAGAEVDDGPAPPLTMTGRVCAIKHGDAAAGTEVVLQVGAVLAILTRRRKPYHTERDFTALGLRPRDAHVVVVKIGYLEPELYAMARGWMLALTPGGVDQDLQRLGHVRIHRPMWPFDTTFATPPDLRVRWIAKSNEPLDGVDE